MKPKGVIGGGQFGYDYQINPTWVVGLEADLQASDEYARDGQSASTGGTSTNPGITGLTSSNAAATFEGRISWFATARARAGVLITPTTLLYGTGGLAFGGREGFRKRCRRYRPYGVYRWYWVHSYR